MPNAVKKTFFAVKIHEMPEKHTEKRDFSLSITPL